MTALLSLRVIASAWLVRRRRVVAPAGESLSFVAPNESNQSKGALHFSQLRGYKGSADEAPCHSDRPHTCCDRKSRRCAASRVAPPSDELSSAGLCGSARSAHRHLTSRRLFERSERSERSELGATRKDRAAQGSPRIARAEEAGSLLCLLSCRHKKVGRPPGRTPGAVDQARQKQPRDSGTDRASLRYLRPSGWW